MPKCDVCSKEITEKDMQIIPGAEVSNLTRAGFVPTQVGTYSQSISDIKKKMGLSNKQIWDLSISQNPSSDWGFCRDCYFEFKASEEKLQTSFKQTTNSLSQVTKDKDISKVDPSQLPKGFKDFFYLTWIAFRSGKMPVTLLTNYATVSFNTFLDSSNCCKHEAMTVFRRYFYPEPGEFLIDFDSYHKPYPHSFLTSNRIILKNLEDEKDVKYSVFYFRDIKSWKRSGWWTITLTINTTDGTYKNKYFGYLPKEELINFVYDENKAAKPWDSILNEISMQDIEQAINDNQLFIERLTAHRTKMLSSSAQHVDFLQKYLSSDVIDTLSKVAAEKMRLTLGDKKEHSQGLAKSPVYYVVCTVPGSIKKTASLFESNYGGYSKVLEGLWNSSAFTGTGCEVLIHITYGRDKEEGWVNVTIFPIKSTQFSFKPIIAIDLLSQSERQSMGIS